MVDVAMDSMFTTELGVVMLEEERAWPAATRNARTAAAEETSCIVIEIVLKMLIERFKLCRIVV